MHKIKYFLYKLNYWFGAYKHKEIIYKLDNIHRHIKDIQMEIKTIKQREILMSAELDDLAVAVEENTTLDGSIIALVDGLAEQIAALKDDPARLVALAASLRGKSVAIAAAIAANTPAAPPV